MKTTNMCIKLVVALVSTSSYRGRWQSYITRNVSNIMLFLNVIHKLLINHVSVVYTSIEDEAILDQDDLGCISCISTRLK